MSRDRLVLVVAVGVFALLGPTAAQAKGPLQADLVISGGDLAKPVRIPSAVIERLDSRYQEAVSGYIEAPAPEAVSPIEYRIDFYQPGTSNLYFSYLYAPSPGGGPGMVRSVVCFSPSGCWFGKLHPDFDALLRSYLSGRSPGLPPQSGPPIAGPAIAISLILCVVWVVRRPRLRKRFARLAY